MVGQLYITSAFLFSFIISALVSGCICCVTNDINNDSLSTKKKQENVQCEGQQAYPPRNCGIETVRSVVLLEINRLYAAELAPKNDFGIFASLDWTFTIQPSTCRAMEEPSRNILVLIRSKSDHSEGRTTDSQTDGQTCNVLCPKAVAVRRYSNRGRIKMTTNKKQVQMIR